MSSKVSFEGVAPVSHVELDATGAPIVTPALEAELVAAEAEIARGDFFSLEEALALIRRAA